MQLTKQIYLYSTSNCHLCELALDLVMLQSVSEHVTIIEISDNKNLLEIYETRIPVLQRSDTQAELSWPFDENDLQQFLSA
jgi:hypothetical protein